MLPAIAERHGIPLTQLEDVAQRWLFSCALCVGPMPEPKLYGAPKHPIAFLCGRCFAAVEKTGASMLLLARHWRFNTDHRANRGRLARFMMLHQGLPDEVTAYFDAEDERNRVELLAEDQAIDPLLVEDNEDR